MLIGFVRVVGVLGVKKFIAYFTRVAVHSWKMLRFKMHFCGILVLGRFAANCAFVECVFAD